MADNMIQNYVNGQLVDSTATEFTELVDAATGKVTGVEHVMSSID